MIPTGPAHGTAPGDARRLVPVPRVVLPPLPGGGAQLEHAGQLHRQPRLPRRRRLTTHGRAAARGRNPGAGVSVVSPVTGWLRSVAPRKADLRADLVAGLPTRSATSPTAWPPASSPASTRSTACTPASSARSLGGFGSSTRLMVITTTSAASLAAGSAVGRGRPAAPRRRARPAGPVAGGLMIVAGVAQPRPLHPLRVALGDARLPHRRRGEHHLRPAPRPTGTSPSGDVQRWPRRSTWSSIPAGSTWPSLLVGLGALGHPGRSWRARRSAIVSRADRPRRADGRGRSSAGSTASLAVERPAARSRPAPAAGAARPSALFIVDPAARCRGGRGDRARPGRRRRRVGAEPRRAASDANRDFIAQGAGNVAAGFFRGMPVGGSVGSDRAEHGRRARAPAGRRSSPGSGWW